MELQLAWYSKSSFCSLCTAIQARTTTPSLPTDFVKDANTVQLVKSGFFQQRIPAN